MAHNSKMVGFIKKVMRDKKLLYDLRNLNQNFFFTFAWNPDLHRGCLGGGDRQTDGQTDRRTDRQTDGHRYDTTPSDDRGRRGGKIWSLGIHIYVFAIYEGTFYTQFNLSIFTGGLTVLHL